MRIQEKSSGPWLLRIAAFFSKKKFGKVIAPLRTIYAIQPALLGIVIKIANAEKKLSLKQGQRYLITSFVSFLNDCRFCSDLNFYIASRMDVEKEKLRTLLNFRNEKGFTDAEKAMLAYCEEVTLTKTCTESCFHALKQHFNEKEIVEITWLNAVENYFNLQAKPLKIPSDNLYSPL